jgi:hypothetical protein
MLGLTSAAGKNSVQRANEVLSAGSEEFIAGARLHENIQPGNSIISKNKIVAKLPRAQIKCAVAHRPTLAPARILDSTSLKSMRCQHLSTFGSFL